MRTSLGIDQVHTGGAAQSVGDALASFFIPHPLSEERCQVDHKGRLESKGKERFGPTNAAAIEWRSDVRPRHWPTVGTRALGARMPPSWKS